MKKFIRNSLLILTVLVLSITVFPKNLVAFADEPITENGKYDVPIEKLMAMGQQYFSDSVTVEKLGSKYYMTISIDASMIGYLDIISEKEDKVGVIEKAESGKFIYTYSLPRSAFDNEIKFKAFILAMKTEKEFSIKLKLNEAKKISDKIDDLGERPALYIPSLETLAVDDEIEKGTVYPVPTATAKLNGKDLTVEIKAFYKRNGESTEVQIVDGKLKLENIGEYHIVYRAESDLYTTSLSQPTFAQKDVKIISKIGAESLVKAENTDEQVLPDGYGVQASRLGEGNETFEIAKEKMKDFSENFEVITFKIFDKSGNEITPDGKINVYLKTNPYLDRTKAIVYHLNDDGELEEICAKGYGRYMQLETDKTGDFIVCVEGIEFVMPMWGYALITVLSGVALIGVIVTLTVVFIKKKKKTIE